MDRKGAGGDHIAQACQARRTPFPTWEPPPVQTAVSPAWQLADGHSVFLAVKHVALLQQMNRAIFFLRNPAQAIQTAHDGVLVTRLEMAQVDVKTALLQVLTDILRKAVRRVVPCQVGEGLVVAGEGALGHQPAQVLPLARQPIDVLP